MENLVIFLVILAGIFFLAMCILGGIVRKQAEKINALEQQIRQESAGGKFRNADNGDFL